MLQNGLTPLHLTAQEDKVSAAEVLAKYDANLDQQTKVWTETQLSLNHYWGRLPQLPGNTYTSLLTDFRIQPLG